MDIYYDVIIVGSGVAGCFSALQLPKQSRILIITKKSLVKSNSFLAQGGICVLKELDDRESFIEDTLFAGHYENNRQAVEIMVDSSFEICQELETLDVEFDKRNGDYLYTKEGAHSIPRILYYQDSTGKEITSKLLEAVKKQKNITILAHTEVIDLLVDNNRCYGVVINNQKQKPSYLFSNDIILATGGVGGMFEHSTNYPHIQGDGLILAMRHQVKCENLDYIQIHPTTLYSSKPGRRFLISESVRGEGALLYNKEKERFVDELLPRDVLTKAIIKQMQKDKQPFVWLSMKDITMVDINKRFPTIVEHCKKEGINPKKDWIPVVPAQHYFMGGIHTDMNGRTSMRHLYAVGEVASNGVHGKNRLASNSLLESLVFAKRAAKSIGRSKVAFDVQRAKSNNKVYQKETNTILIREKLLYKMKIKE